jgi:hypothetical protein
MNDAQIKAIKDCLAHVDTPGTTLRLVSAVFDGETRNLHMTTAVGHHHTTDVIYADGTVDYAVAEG